MLRFASADEDILEDWLPKTFALSRGFSKSSIYVP